MSSTSTSMLARRLVHTSRASSSSLRPSQPRQQPQQQQQAHTKKDRSLPKRDPTLYIPQHHVPRDQWPSREQTDTKSHPLWRFFNDDGESLATPDRSKDTSGRSWTAVELRRKSFTDLHKLWYLCLRERNVLLTQRAEAQRLNLDVLNFSHLGDKSRKCQKTMARIKQVLSERKKAAIEAVEILRARGEYEKANLVEQDVLELEEGLEGGAVLEPEPVMAQEAEPVKEQGHGHGQQKSA